MGGFYIITLLKNVFSLLLYRIYHNKFLRKEEKLVFKILLYKTKAIMIHSFNVLFKKKRKKEKQVISIYTENSSILFIKDPPFLCVSIENTTVERLISTGEKVPSLFQAWQYHPCSFFKC